ncbi:MAG: phage tail tape measure protein [Nanoarchaeota archaeon]
MKDKLIDIATVTKFSTTELATGMVILGQAGLSAEESINALSAVANLATGTLSDMALVADLVTTAIRAFNIDSVESGRIADVFANAINKSKLTVDKLRTAFNYVGASAAQVGLSLEETAASMMVLANSGLRASTIGTGLRQVLSRMIAPNRKLREAFEEHGIALDDLNPKVAGYQKSMMKLAGVLWDNEKKAVDMTKAYQLFGLRGAQAVAVLIQAFVRSGKGSFDEAIDYTLRAGAAAEMAAKQAEGLGVMFKNLADRAKILALGMGDEGVVGAFQVFINVLKTVTEYLSKFLSTGFGSFIAQLLLLSTALTVTVKAFQMLFNVIKSAVLIQAIINFKGYVLALKAVFHMLAIGATTASAAVGTFSIVLKSLNIYLFAIVAAISAVIIAYNQMSAAEEKAILDSKKRTVALQGSIGSLEVYKTSLEGLIESSKKGNDVSKQYEAYLIRLKEAHPELTDAINLTTASMTEMFEIVKKLQEAERGQYLKNMVNDAVLLAKQLQGVNTKIQAMEESGGKTTNLYTRRVKERTRIQKEQGKALEAVVGLMAEEVVQGKRTQAMALSVIENTARSMGMTEKQIFQIRDDFLPLLEKVRVKFKEVGGGVLLNLKGVPEEFTRLIKLMDPRDYEAWSTALSKATSELAKFEKNKKRALEVAPETKEKWDIARQELIDSQIKGLEEIIRKRTVAENKSALDNIKRLYTERMSYHKDVISNLIREEKRLSDEIKKVRKEMEESSKKYEEHLRDIRYAEVSDDKKAEFRWYEVRGLLDEGNRLYNEEKFKESGELYKEAVDRAASLAKEIATDIKEGTRIGITGQIDLLNVTNAMEIAHNNYLVAKKAEKAVLEEQKQKTIDMRQEAVVLVGTLNRIKEALWEVINTPFDINTDEAMKKLQGILDRTGSIKTMIDSVRDGLKGLDAAGLAGTSVPGFGRKDSSYPSMPSAPNSNVVSSDKSVRLYLNINGTVSSVYGSDKSIRSIITSLRRSGLVAA